MSNPLFSMMNGQMPQAMMNPMIQLFQQVRNMFRGNPQQHVQHMLNSGKVTQEQYNQAVQMANQMQWMLGGK